MTQLTVEHHADLSASPARVWALATAVRLWPLWLRDVDAVRADGRPAPGLRFVVQRAGQPLADRWIVADWEPPHAVRFTDYGRDLQLALQIVETPAGARLTARLEWPRPRGLLGGVLGRATPGGRLAAGLAGSLAELQRLVGSGRDQELLQTRSSS